MRNPYDPADHWAEDYKLWIRSRQKDDLAIGFIREPLYFYRELGSMTLDKVLRAQRVGRSFIARNGPHMAGVLPTTYLLGRSIMKTIAFRMAWHTGVFDGLIRSRSSEVDELLFDSIRIDIERMKSLDF